MTESEIKLMLKDIIDNNAEYECKPNFDCDVNCKRCRYEWYCNWRPYKLGDEIHPGWEYRKVEKWYIYKSITEANGFTKGNDGFWYCSVRYKDEHTIFSGSEEECEKWIKEHTKKTWLEERKSCLSVSLDKRTIAINCYEAGVKEVCKKILEEVGNYCECTDELVGKEELFNIIKNLGIEL